MSKLDQLKALGDAKRASRKDSGIGRGERLQEVISPATLPKVLVSAKKISKGTGASGVVGSTPTNSTKLKRGRPKIAGPRPWEAEGISKRTYYRRQAEKKGK